MDDPHKFDLGEFAVRFYGFEKTDKSTKNSPSLKNAKGDHIVIKYHPGGNCSFFDPQGEHKGDIYRFIQWQENCDFKTAAQKLRECLGMENTANQTRPPVPKSQGAAKVFDKGAASRLTPVARHAYLENERGIPEALLSHPRFAGTIFTDEYRNAVFPHYKEGEIVGYTKKNSKFSGFSEGGEKLLWRSKFFPQVYSANRFARGERNSLRKLLPACANRLTF